MQLVKWVLSQDPHADSRASRRSRTTRWNLQTPPKPSTKPQSKQVPLKVEVSVKDKPKTAAKKPKTTEKSKPKKQPLQPEKKNYPRRKPNVDLPKGPTKKGETK